MMAIESRRYDELIPSAIVAFAAAVFAVDLGATLMLRGVAGFANVAVVVGRVLALSFCVGIAVGGYWLYQEGFDVERYRRVAFWFVIFTVGFTALNLLLIVFFPADTLFNNLTWLTFALYSGGGGGLAIGVAEARAIERAVTAERRAAEAEHLEAQHKWFDYMKSLLRHEVLNNASIIEGYASLLQEERDLPPEIRDDVETILHQTEDMTAVIEDIEVLVRASDQVDVSEAVDVVTVLTEELEDLRATYPDVEVDLAVHGEPEVLADDLLAQIFSNVLANAVEHNDVENPTVGITVDTTSAFLTVEIADNGPGIPEDERETLFDRDEEHEGLGLHLVRLLVDRYDGSIELTETGPEGSVFTVRLPRADRPEDAEASNMNPDASAMTT